MSKNCLLIPSADVLKSPLQLGVFGVGIKEFGIQVNLYVGINADSFKLLYIHRERSHHRGIDIDARLSFHTDVTRIVDRIEVIIIQAAQTAPSALTNEACIRNQLTATYSHL